MNENDQNRGTNQGQQPTQPPYEDPARYGQPDQQYNSQQQPSCRQNGPYRQDGGNWQGNPGTGGNNAPNGSQGPNNWQPPVPPPPVYTSYDAGGNARVFSILSYIGILWLVGLLADRYNPKVRFHVNQGIILTVCTIVFRAVISMVEGIVKLIFYSTFLLTPLGAILNAVLSLVGWGLPLAFMIIGILHAVQDRDEPLPLIGNLFRALR